MVVNFLILQVPSCLKISNASFKNIRGTLATQLIVKLECSSGIPCENVVIADIDISYIGIEGPVTSECSNSKPTTIAGKQNPQLVTSLLNAHPISS